MGRHSRRQHDRAGQRRAARGPDECGGRSAAVVFAADVSRASLALHALPLPCPCHALPPSHGARRPAARALGRASRRAAPPYRTRKQPWHPGPPDFIFLDHGMSFYHTGPPRDSPLSKPDTPFCVFRRPIIARLHALESHGSAKPLSGLLLPKVPPPILRVLSPKVLSACQTRLDQVLAQVRKCLTRWPEDTVLVP